MQPNDPRTDPRQYGPQDPLPMGSQLPGLTPPMNLDLGQMFREAVGALEPAEEWFFNSWGTGVKNRRNMDLVGQAAASGETPTDLTSYADAEDASKEAMRLAQESLTMSDAEFEKMFQGLAGQIQGRPELPMRGEAGPMDPVTGGVTALAAALFPKHAFEIGSVPFALQQKQLDDQLAADRIQYGEEMAARGDKIRLAEMRLSLADKRRSDAVRRLQELADEASKLGQQKRSAALSMQSQIWGSKDEAEMDGRIDQLRRFAPEFLPSPDAVKGMRAQFAADKKLSADKAKLDSDKFEEDRIKSVVDDTMKPLQARIQAGGGLSIDEAKQLEADIQAAARDNGIPRSRFGPPIRAFEGTAGRAADRAGELLPGQLRIQGLQEQDLQGRINERIAKPPKDKAQKQGRIATLDRNIDLARAKTQTYVQSKPKSFDTKDGLIGGAIGGATEWMAGFRKALQDEYEPWAEKQHLLTGSYPPFEEYVRTQMKRFGMVAGTIGKQPKGAIPPLNPAGGDGWKVNIR